MSPEVTAAIIAASISFLTLIGTLAAQYLSRRATRNDFKEQGERLDRTLAEQLTRTLNERFATAAEQLVVISQRRSGSPGCTPWRA
jgi:hypothetical protein